MRFGTKSESEDGNAATLGKTLSACGQQNTSEESRQRMQRALDELWMYTGELFETDEADHAMIAAGMGSMEGLHSGKHPVPELSSGGGDADVVAEVIRSSKSQAKLSLPRAVRLPLLSVARAVSV
mgnify:CR=1 FL=1